MGLFNSILFILLLLGTAVLAGFIGYSIGYQDSSIASDSLIHKSCETTNSIIDTLNSESAFINKYCGSKEIVLQNVTKLKCNGGNNG